VKKAQGGHMGKLFRFGVSLEKSLLDRFDKLIGRENYTNRSEAIRDLIRQEFVRKQWAERGNVAGAITLVYDHHKRELLETLTHIQHDYQKIIISTQHVHLDHQNCLEIIAVRGRATDVQLLADTLKSIKGVKHGTLSMSTTGREMF